MSGIIEPKVLKGFRDFLPPQEIIRKNILRTLEELARSFGYVPIDTPVLEYTEVLLGKGGGETDKQVYHFLDSGGRDVAMRFDLTVPFARFMAAHFRELPLPFKRFHFAKVYRGENTQRGRYREFVQCDFDSVGVDSASADLEILLLMHSAFTALGVPDITIRLSHRGIFNRFLESHGIQSHSVEILRAVDKLAKIGSNKVRGMLEELVSADLAGQILDFVGAGSDAASDAGLSGALEVLGRMEDLAGGPAEDSARLGEVIRCLDGLGHGSAFKLDPSITRGLDYYTGIVYETFLNRLPDIGSVCSGGRYNNLAGLYTKEELPGVGSSIGLDRLVAALEELGALEEQTGGPQVLVFFMDASLLSRYHATAAELRKQGISAEVYPSDRKMAAQFSYAEKRGIAWGIFIGSEEAASGQVQLKNLRTRESREGISLDTAIEILKPEG